MLPNHDMMEVVSVGVPLACLGWHRVSWMADKYIYIYIYIYIVYMWQKSSVFSHGSAQRNVAGHLIGKMSLKQHGHFATNGFVFPVIRQILQNTEKSTLNLWIVVNKKCKCFLNNKPMMRRNYIHTFIYERSFLACQTFQISNFQLVYTQLTLQNAHTRSHKATYHDEDTIYY